MHTQDRNTCVNGVNVAVCHILCNGTAATLVYFAHFAHLPNNTIFFKQASKISNNLCRCIAGIIFTTCTGKFAYTHTVIDFGFTALFRHFRIERIKGSGDIGGETEAVFKAAAEKVAEAKEELHNYAVDVIARIVTELLAALEEYSGKEEDKEHKSVVIFAVTNELEYFGCGVAEAANKEKDE